MTPVGLHRDRDGDGLRARAHRAKATLTRDQPIASYAKHCGVRRCVEVVATEKLIMADCLTYHDRPAAFGPVSNHRNSLRTQPCVWG